MTGAVRRVVLVLALGGAGGRAGEGQEPGPAHPLGLETQLDAAYEHLSAGLPAWRDASLTIERPPAGWGSAYAAIAATDRFARRDVELRAGGALRLSRWTLGLWGSASPSHEVLATWSLGTDVARELARGWVLHGGLRGAEYDVASTVTGALSVERYWRGFRTEYALWAAKLEGAPIALTHRLQMDRYYGPDDLNRLGAWLSLGRELEPQGAQVVRFATTSVGLSARHWLTPQWALAGEASWTRQGDVYTRIGTRVGLRRRF